MLNSIKNASKNTRITIAVSAIAAFAALLVVVFIYAVGLAIDIGEYIMMKVDANPAVWMLTGIATTAVYGLISVLSNRGDTTEDKVKCAVGGGSSLICIIGCMYSPGFAAYSAATAVALPLFLTAIAKGINPFKGV